MAYWLLIVIYKEKTNNEKIKETVSRAEKHFLQMMKKSPFVVTNYTGLSMVYCEAEMELKKAVNLAKKAQMLVSDVTTNAVVGACFHKSKSYDKAIKALEKAHQMDTRNVWVLYFLGLHLEIQVRKKRLRKRFKKC